MYVVLVDYYDVFEIFFYFLDSCENLHALVVDLFDANFFWLQKFPETDVFIGGNLH